MRNQLIILSLTILFTFVSCSSDDSEGSEQMEANNFENLTGLWSGQSIYIQTGACPISPTGWFNVQMDIAVDNTGAIEIVEERNFSDDSMTFETIQTNWVGMIKENDSIFLEKTYTVSCSGEPREDSANYVSKLIRNGNVLRIDFGATTEVWCQPQDCVFDRQYRLTK